MASRVYHLNGLQIDQATSGAYYNIIIRGSGFVRDTGVQNISGQKSFYDTATFYSGLNLTGDFVPSGNVAGNLTPKTDDLYDLGSATKEWKNIYCDGTGWFDTLVVDENLTVATGLSVGGNAIVTGNLNLTGNFTVTGDFLPKNIATHFLPKTSNLYDLGSSTGQFRNAYFQSLSVSENITGVGDLNINRLFVSGTGIPTGTGAAGTRGQFAIGSGHLYICTGTNAWGRTHLTGWI